MGSYVCCLRSVQTCASTAGICASSYAAATARFQSFESLYCASTALQEHHAYNTKRRSRICVTSPVSEHLPRTSARSHRTSVEKTRSVHYHRGRFAGITWPYYCGSSPCVRIVVAEPPPVYRASVLWWPGYYDYAPGQFGRGHPRWGGYPRHSGYHGD
jgi:hypothetical protein